MGEPASKKGGGKSSSHSVKNSKRKGTHSSKKRRLRAAYIVLGAHVGPGGREKVGADDEKFGKGRNLASSRDGVGRRWASFRAKNGWGGRCYLIKIIKRRWSRKGMVEKKRGPKGKGKAYAGGRNWKEGGGSEVKEDDKGFLGEVVLKKGVRERGGGG